MDAHHASHGVGVGDPDRIVAKLPGLLDDIHRIRRAAKEAKAAHQPKLHERRAWRRIDRIGAELDPAPGYLEIVFGHVPARSSFPRRRESSCKLGGSALAPRLRGDDEAMHVAHPLSSSTVHQRAPSGAHLASSPSVVHQIQHILLK